MVDFSRRNFLKGLGLGTVAALTLPKRIDVVAATLADLESPPLSAGYACLKMENNVSIYTMNMSNPFNENLSIRIFMNYQKDMSMEVARMITPSGSIGYISCGGPVYILPESLNVPRSHKFEVWVLRDEGRLPITKEVTFTLSGTFFQGPGSGSNIVSLPLPIRNVRIDRARAIQLGLSDPSEPIVEETEVTQSLFVN